jgi:hypothetical protein
MFESLMRRGWQIGGSLTAAVVLVMGTAQTVSTISHNEYSTVERFDARGVRLVEIHNSAAGAVRVVGTGDTDEIVVRTEVSDGLEKTSHSERIDGERLVLDTQCPFWTSFCEVRYEVEMPADLALDVWSPENITVEDVDGDVKVSSDGAIDVARLGGRLEADGMDGSITARDLRSSDVVADVADGRVTLDFAEAPLSVRAKSVDGSIDILVPEGPEEYRVATDTVDGSAGTQVSNGPNGDRTITASTTDGDVLIRYRS